MRINEILDKSFSPRLSVYLDDVKDEDIPEIAGMLRGLKCSIEGWGSISGITNEKFLEESPVILEFSSTDNAHYFKRCVNYYFDDNILKALKLKKRVYR
jgi:hypothetical protein